MYLELKNIHKSFGSGDNRTEVLRGIGCGVEKRRYLCFTWTIRFRENPPY